MVDHKESSFPDAITIVNFCVYNLLTKSIADNEIVNGMCIYSLTGDRVHKQHYLLLRYDNDIVIIDMPYSKKPEDVSIEIIDYFKKHPEVDRRLLPYYIEAAMKVFLINTENYQKGEWYMWHAGEKLPYLDMEKIY